MNSVRLGLATLCAFAAALATTSAIAGPMYTLSASQGTQPSNAGEITLTQDGADSVIVDVDLISPYGILNTGGPHTPLAFELSVPGDTGLTDLSVLFSSPSGGAYTSGTFSLDTSGGSNTPYGSFNVAINDSAGNGSSKAYYGDLDFILTDTNGLSTTDFITNGTAYFTADLTNGASSTGAQAWESETIDPVPEPGTVFLFGGGLLALGALVRRRFLSARALALPYYC